MDTSPITRPAFGQKLLDFAFGSLLIGASPLATIFGLVYILDLPSSLILRHFGQRTVLSYQMVTGLSATLLALSAFGCAIWWRTRHRVIKKSLLPMEIIVAIVWAFFFFAFIGVLIGPNDDYNR